MSVYKSREFSDWLLDWRLARDDPRPGTLERTSAVRAVVEAVDDDGPRGVASCGGVALRCDAVAGAFDAGVCDG